MAPHATYREKRVHRFYLDTRNPSHLVKGQTPTRLTGEKKNTQKKISYWRSDITSTCTTKAKDENEGQDHFLKQNKEENY